jgi:hypothetical protein
MGCNEFIKYSQDPTKLFSSLAHLQVLEFISKGSSNKWRIMKQTGKNLLIFYQKFRSPLAEHACRFR